MELKFTNAIKVLCDFNKDPYLSIAEAEQYGYAEALQKERKRL